MGNICLDRSNKTPPLSSQPPRTISSINIENTSSTHTQHVHPLHTTHLKPIYHVNNTYNPDVHIVYYPEEYGKYTPSIPSAPIQYVRSYENIIPQENDKKIDILPSAPSEEEFIDINLDKK